MALRTCTIAVRLGVAAVLFGTAAGPTLSQDDTGNGKNGGAAQPAQVERGEYLLHAGGCITCHSKDTEDATPLAGGRALETRFGTFYSPNITPDPETGIGDWSAAQFVRALKHGISPAGDPYYPAFPYPSYAGMTEADARALYAYLQSREPVARRVPDHELDFPYSIRLILWPWRWLFFEAKTFEPDPQQSESVNRGEYLVRHLGHCGECHTPRNRFGAKIAARHLAGNPDGPEGKAVPNITPHEADGIGGWAKVDVTFFLETGFYPDGDVAGSGMSAVIRDSTGELTRDDRAAIADYLLSRPAIPEGGG